MSFDTLSMVAQELPIKWIVFWAVFGSALLFDILFNKGKELTLKSAALQTVFYILVALAFGAFVFMDMGPEAGAAWFSIWSLEYSLSFDNLFVIDVVMTLLGIVAVAQQRTLLYWGIIGAILLRGSAIAAGALVIERFWWVLPLMGIFLIATAVKLFEEALGKEDEDEKEPFFVRLSKAFKFPRWFIGWLEWLNSPESLVKWLTDFRFGVFGTAILAVELTDIGFAVDSLPTGFSISQDPFLVFSANMIAISGLRALFFCVQALKEQFRFLGFGVSAVLLVVGIKIIGEHLGQIADFIESLHLHDIEVSTTMSLGVIAAILGTSILASLWASRKEAKEEAVAE